MNTTAPTAAGSNPLIRRAAEDDLDSILQLAAEAMLGPDADASRPQERGFLVSGFTRPEYERFLSQAEHFYVAVLGKETLVGFLLAYDSESVHREEVVNTLLRSNLVEPFILIKQIVVAPQHGGRGIASALYRHLFSQALGRSCLAAIATEPVNTPSIRFHWRLGFAHLFDIIPPPDRDGIVRPRSIWYRGAGQDPGRRPATRLHPVDHQADIDQLLAKQHDAVALYTHEDNLNWTKLGMLVTFMMALVAAFSFLWEREATPQNLFLGVLTILFGFLVNFIFFRTIGSGLVFMQSHKEKVKLYEAKLLTLNPNLTPTIDTANKGIAGQSATAALLRFVPLASFFIWSICSLLLLLKELAVWPVR